jgi:hypothetical protein
MGCRNCVYNNTDYIWDEQAEEEYGVHSCDKDRGEFENCGENCPCFKEFPPYVEKLTKCDECDNLSICVLNGYLLECTGTEDSRRHYTMGMGTPCMKNIQNNKEMR